MTFSKAINRSLKTLSLSVISIGLSLFTACTSLNTLVINVEKPAQITLPNNISTIAIVDNSVPQTEDIGHTEYIRDKKSKSLIKVNTDSLNYILAAQLFNDIADKEYFEDVIFYERPLREDADFEKIVPLDTILAQKICDANKADAIISIDRFLVSTVSFDEDLEYGAIVKYLFAKMDVRFQVYSKEGKAISNPLYINDSIYWSAAYSQNTPLFDSIPSRENAMKESARYMAGKMADALAPYWNNELRWYYGDIKPANKMMANNDWAGALPLWKEAYETEIKNTKKKARLANNIALAYELSDDLKEALRWITISCDLFSQTIGTSIDQENLDKATKYKDDLLERYNDFKLLDLRKKDSK